MYVPLLLLARTWSTVFATGLEVSREGTNTFVAHEADFYTAEEAAKVLGIPVKRVFGMLCGGEMEGHQDEWARWLVPASAVQGARLSYEAPTYPDGLPEHDAEFHVAMEKEIYGQDAAETVVLSDGRPLLEPTVHRGFLGGEETTQETDEALVGGSPASRPCTESSDVETAERLPLDVHSEATTSAAAPDETIKHITERLAAAAAHTRELRGRLKLAEATEAALRESLERERGGVDRDSARAEQHAAVTERLEKEPAAGWGDGFWRGLFGG